MAETVTRLVRAAMEGSAALVAGSLFSICLQALPHRQQEAQDLQAGPESLQRAGAEEQAEHAW